jgi:hypothetical protein
MLPRTAKVHSSRTTIGTCTHISWFVSACTDLNFGTVLLRAAAGALRDVPDMNVVFVNDAVQRLPATEVSFEVWILFLK